MAEEIDRDATPFGKFEEAKSRITIDLKATIVIRKKNKMVKKLKEKIGEGKEEEEGQAPLELTEGLDEDKDNDEEDAEQRKL